MGGKSEEHPVSMQSGKAIIRQLNSSRYNIKPIIISKDGKWIIPENFLNGKEAKKFSIETLLKAEPGLRRLNTVHSFHREARTKIHLAILALHGRHGEDGAMQGLLETMGIPYTGSGILGSALSLDKIMAKKIYESKNIPTPEYAEITFSQWKGSRGKLLKILEKKFSFPLVLKIPHGGSSIGVVMVKSSAHLISSLDKMFKSENRLMVEHYLKGREFSCGVFEDLKSGNNFAFPVTEIIPNKARYFDLKSKYDAGGAKEITPAKITASVSRRIQEFALKAHAALSCRVYSRTDFIWDYNYFNILETNTLPGMTPASILPKQAKAYGWSYSKLLDQIVEVSLRKFS